MRRLRGGRGTSNLEVIQKGTPECLRSEVREKVEGGVDIIGPECAVPLDAPYLNMKLLAEEASRGWEGSR